MFGQCWNPGTIRKYVIYFGMMFNDVILTRDDAEGNQVQVMKVPLNYGPKEKFLARLVANPDLNRPIAISLPRMSFQIVDYRFDHQRKMSTVGRLTGAGPNPNTKSYQYNPVPYDFDFELYIMVKNAEDGTRIVEQILPFFAPEWTATLNVNPDLGIKYDVPIVINQIRQEDTYDGNFEERRSLVWTLNFTMKGWLFGPTKTGGIIKQTMIDLHIPPTGQSISTTDPAFGNILVEPGLTANGQPTSNAAASIDYNLINSTDDYGFITEFTENI